MPSKIRKNSYYNDPALGAGLDNLAKAFAPPTGTDMYGYAHAAATRAKEGRLAELFANAQNPNVTPETLDRLGIGAGAFNPNQSFMYGDRANATSRANNTATVQGGLDVAKINNAGALARQFALPIHVNENSTVRLPEQTAAATGLPAMFAGQSSVGQGETIRPADGSGPIVGTLAPKTKAQVEGDVLAGLPASDQRATTMAQVPTETVQRPDGTAEIVMRPDAAGRTPVLDETKKPKPQLSNYKLPDVQGKPGYAGTAVFDDKVGWKDSQTGEPLPAGAVTYTAALTGDKPGTGLGQPTTANNTSANNRGAEVTRTLNTLDRYEAILRNNPGAVGLPGLIRGTAQNAVGVTQDMARSFGKTVPQLQEATSDIRNGLQRVAPEMFDPAIPEANFMQGTLAYALARTENPSGEVSRQAYERAHQRIAGGVLANTDQLLATTGAFRKSLQTELDAIGALRNPGGARTDTGYKDPTVAAVAGAPATPAPAPVAPTAGALPVVNTPEEAAALPPGTRFKTPDGREKVRP